MAGLHKRMLHYFRRMMHGLVVWVRGSLLCLGMLALQVQGDAQIINIENSRIQSDTTGLRGTLGTNFGFTKNVQEIIHIDASMHLQYKTSKDLYLVLANYNLLRNREQTLSNNMFYHLRYNRKLNEWLRWEAFSQWQQNTVTNIDLRFLAGTGPRFKLHESAKFRLYAATLVMYEQEKERSPKITHSDMRSDTYVSFTYRPTELLALTSTTFYQPLFHKPKDFRILNQFTLNVKATRRLTIVTNWSYLFDSAPATGTPKVNYAIGNGFSYTFK